MVVGKTNIVPYTNPLVYPKLSPGGNYYINKTGFHVIVIEERTPYP